MNLSMGQMHDTFVSEGNTGGSSVAHSRSARAIMRHNSTSKGFDRENHATGEKARRMVSRCVHPFYQTGTGCKYLKLFHSGARFAIVQCTHNPVLLPDVCCGHIMSTFVEEQTTTYKTYVCTCRAL